VITSALAALALFGAQNARNYRSYSTMRILPEMTISSSIRRHCAHYRQIQIQPRYDRLGLNRFQNVLQGYRIADVALHFSFPRRRNSSSTRRQGSAARISSNATLAHTRRRSLRSSPSHCNVRSMKREKLLELHPPDSSFADASLSGQETPSTPGADLRACILPPMWLCLSCTPIVSSLRNCFVSVMRIPVSHPQE
jgi:hypothetical protein